ncbi:relaxase/mobilization nuclease domain-containing protein [Methylotenera sp.]|uniref:LPD7 domain-containing protein n=1 Tax=Methylotenera sp. TaxID=2051956 RepID=UPI002486F4EE|nr:relaxase/mobilization nuclease domain-containing protein [Methylotenera sp.]MDI1298702.1 relaxase/mobilization nuclease domain-containing protein [Methylotenera sp.]
MSAVIKEIANKNTGRIGLKNLLDYLEKPEAKQEHGYEAGKEKAFDVWHENAFSNETADIEMMALAESNALSRIPFRHYVISFSEGEEPNREQAYQAVKMLLDELDLARALVKCAMHYDQDNTHIHVAIIMNNPITEKSFPLKFQKESSQRAVAKINYIQGWEKDAGQRYIIDSDGACVRSGDANIPSLKGREVEVFSGQRSASDIARDAITDVLKDKNIKCWDDLHAVLASQGVTYEKKGSGATIDVRQGDEIIKVKASTANRSAALGKMESRFGAYEKSTHPISARKVEPMKGMAPGAKEVWHQYNAEKVSHRGYKKNKTDELRAKHQADFSLLMETHKQAREKLNASRPDWKGNGSALNALRSVLAHEHASQKELMKHAHSIERQLLKMELSIQTAHPGKFGDYVRDRSEDLHQLHTTWRVAPNNIALRQGDGDNGVKTSDLGALFVPVKHGISAYEAEMTTHDVNVRSTTGHVRSVKETIVNYKNNDSGDIDFVDSGRKISLLKERDQSIKAMIQLSSQKWKTFQLTGSDEFKRRAVDVAIKLGVANKITNPDLQAYIIDQQDKSKGAMLGHVTASASAKIDAPSPKSWNKAIEKPRLNLKHVEVPVFDVDDVKSKMELAHEAYANISNEIGDNAGNQSRKDLMIANVMHEIGYKRTAIVDAIKVLSDNSKDHKVHENYAEKLADHAQSVKGITLRHENRQQIDEVRTSVGKVRGSDFPF